MTTKRKIFLCLELTISLVGYISTVTLGAAYLVNPNEYLVPFVLIIVLNAACVGTLVPKYITWRMRKAGLNVR